MTAMPINTLIIWWINQEDVLMIMDYKKLKVGRKYINQELSSCFGRNGRGRLWINDYIEERYLKNLIEVDPDLYSWSYGLGRILARDYAGIVIEKKDYSVVKDLPGIFTDFELNRWLGV